MASVPPSVLRQCQDVPWRPSQTRSTVRYVKMRVRSVGNTRRHRDIAAVCESSLCRSVAVDGVDAVGQGDQGCVEGRAGSEDPLVAGQRQPVQHG